MKMIKFFLLLITFFLTIQNSKSFKSLNITNKNIKITCSVDKIKSNPQKYELSEEQKRQINNRRKLSLLSVLIMTILHEVMHCLSNILPTNSKDYNELSNPFIRTFKKNIKVFDLVVGRSAYKGTKGVAEILKENIKDYEYIPDSGHLFEMKLFENYNRAYNYYSDSEYFLNLQNFKVPLEEFLKYFFF